MKSIRILLAAAATLAAVMLSGEKASAQPGQKAFEPAPASSLEYYLPVKDARYNPDILTPQAYMGFDIMDRVADWGDITRYAEYLTSVSDRVSMKVFGYTHERRPIFQMVYTSPANQARLEEIRQEHLKITDPSVSGDLDLANMPLVVTIECSVHGNELTGTQGALALMYHYAAVIDEKTEKDLENTILLIIPGINPDGIHRFAGWINHSASQNHFVDRQAREYHEPRPTSRVNHYWMDCNRDWLTAQFAEGQTAVKMFEYWMPNVLLDTHEMGSSKFQFYFSPGDPDRTYKYIPQENQDLTLAISKYTAAAEDSIGTVWFSQRGYDDYFIGKGACYGDIQGAVCILHEHSSTRGHLRYYDKLNKLVTFADGVRIQSIAEVAVLNASIAMSETLKEYQRNFFINSQKDAQSNPYKGYIFNARGNRGIAWNFVENLLLHDIDVYAVEGFKDQFYVPFDQHTYYKIKGIFEDITEFTSHTFYDISTWSPARAYNLDYQLVAQAPLNLTKVPAEHPFPEGKTNGASSTGYAFESGEYYTPYMINALQNAGVKVSVATRAFDYKFKPAKIKMTFPAGTLVIPVEGQEMDSDKLYETIVALAKECAVEVTGFSTPIPVKPADLSPVRQPRTAIFYDFGSQFTNGAIWYMLDKRFAMNHSLVSNSIMSNEDFNWDNYDVIVVAGYASMKKKPAAALEKWVRNGGTLILQSGGNSLSEYIHAGKSENTNGKGVDGVVLNAKILDSQCPLFWGYKQNSLDIFKNSADIHKVPENAKVVMKFSDNPYRSGYISDKNLEAVQACDVVAYSKLDKGSIVYITENIVYRSYWFGTNHILTNAILFGDKL